MKNESKNTLPWYEVYEKLADLLGVFYVKHGESSSEKLFHFTSTTSNMPDLFDFGMIQNRGLLKIDTSNSIPMKPFVPEGEIDVFHLYAALSNLSNKERLQALKLLISDILGGENLDIDTIDYRGFIKCNMQWTAQVRNDSWALLKSISSSRINPLKELGFEDGIMIGLNEYSQFLYLFNYKCYLPLTNEVSKYLIDNLKISTEITSWKNYFRLLNNKSSDLYKALVIATTDNPDLSKIEQELIKQFINPESLNPKKVESKTIVENKKADKSHGFRLIGIKVLPVEDDNRVIHEKALEINEYYGLYDCYIPQGDNFQYDKNKDTRLYDQSDLKINVSAIVGKNGSGKSTIFELVYMALYNISYKENLIHNYVNKEEKEKLKPIDDLNIELFIETDRLYKIAILGESKPIDIKITPYNLEAKSGLYVPQKTVVWNKKRLEELCYTITINYSIHGLNSRHHGNWLQHLFHKNDSYQVPMVIEPFRSEGNIDVNKQEQLARYRLLANILKIPTEVKKKVEKSEPVINTDYKNRLLVDDKIAHGVLLNFKKGITDTIWINDEDISIGEINNYDKISSEIIGQLKIDLTRIEDRKIQEAIENYLIKKIFKIISTYQHINNTRIGSL